MMIPDKNQEHMPGEPHPGWFGSSVMDFTNLRSFDAPKCVIPFPGEGGGPV
jgi:hypothetical protein